METFHKTGCDSGSVLMEFIVVLPIYMMLLGYAFVVGEFALQAIHLAASADRSYATARKNDIAKEIFDFFSLAVSPDRDLVEPEFSYAGDGGGTEKVSKYRKERIDRVADADFRGPWTKAVASWVKDDYTLTPYTRGIVAFWYRREYDMTDKPQSAGEGPLGKILGGGIGRTEMVGKDLEDSRKYGFYSLMRNEAARKNTAYRKWPAGGLATDYVWRDKVYQEAYASVDYEDVDKGAREGSDAPEWAVDISDYKRDSTLAGWSN